MSRYLLRQLLFVIPSLIGISIVLFTVLALAPGDPFEELATNPAIPAEVRANLRAQFGLDVDEIGARALAMQVRLRRLRECRRRQEGKDQEKRRFSHCTALSSSRPRGRQISSRATNPPKTIMR